MKRLLGGFVRKPSRFAVLLALLTLCVILVPLCIGGAVWALTGSLAQGYQSCLICLAIEGAAIALAGGLYLAVVALEEAAEAREAKQVKPEEERKQREEESPPLQYTPGGES